MKRTSLLTKRLFFFIVLLIFTSNISYGFSCREKYQNLKEQIILHQKAFYKDLRDGPYFSRLIFRSGKSSDPKKKALRNKILNKLSRGNSLKDLKIFNYYQNPEFAGAPNFIVDSILGIGLYLIFLIPAKVAVTDIGIYVTQDKWHRNLFYDFRYDQIRKDRVMGNIKTDFRAYLEMVDLSEQYSKFYDFMDAQPVGENRHDLAEKMVKKFRGSPLFYPIFDLIDHGIRSDPFFYATRPGALKVEERDKLFEYSTNLYTGYETISKWVKGEKMDDRYKAVLEIIFAKPHVKKLLAYRDKGMLTQNQVLNLIGADLFMEAHYKATHLIHVNEMFEDPASGLSESTNEQLADYDSDVDEVIESQSGLP